MPWQEHLEAVVLLVIVLALVALAGIAHPAFVMLH